MSTNPADDFDDVGDAQNEELLKLDDLDDQVPFLEELLQLAAVVLVLTQRIELLECQDFLLHGSLHYLEDLSLLPLLLQLEDVDLVLLLGNRKLDFLIDLEEKIDSLGNLRVVLQLPVLFG